MSFGWRVMFSHRAQALGKPSMLRWIMFAYCVGTGLFAWSRAIWDSSRLLLSLAALHNLMEWGFLAHLHTTQDKIETWFKVAVVWIWLIITLVCTLPMNKFMVAIALEQSTGVVCDYLLLFTFALFLWCGKLDERNKKVSDLYRLGLYAHITHFGQIWPLIVASFGVHGLIASISEWVIYSSALLTFYFDTELVLQWDEYLLFLNTGDGKRNPDGSTSTPTTKDTGNVQVKDDSKREETRVSLTIRERNDPFHSPRTAPGFWWLVVRIYLPSIVLGILTIFGPIWIFGFCPTKPPPMDTVPVTGFTTIDTTPEQNDAVQELLEKMIVPSRAEKGSISYHLYKGATPGHFAFVETWATIDALKTHLAGPAVANVFGSDYYAGLKLKPSTYGPWFNIEPEQPSPTSYAHLAFNFQKDMEIDKLWKALDNWSDCSWVRGSSNCRVPPETPDIRYLNLGKDVTLKIRRPPSAVPHQLIYEVLEGHPLVMGYRAALTLTANPFNPKSTLVNYVNQFIPNDPAQREHIIGLVRADLEARFKWIASDWLVTNNP